jgi:hypothetical protein
MQTHRSAKYALKAEYYKQGPPANDICMKWRLENLGKPSQTWFALAD